MNDYAGCHAAGPLSWLVPRYYLGRRIEEWRSNDAVKVTMKNKLQSKEILQKQIDKQWNEKKGQTLDSTLHKDRENQKQERKTGQVERKMKIRLV